MAQSTSNLPPARHVPAHTNEGWPVAIAIVVLAIVVNTAVYLFHERTSARSPLDVMFRAKGTPTAAQPHGSTGQGGPEGTGGAQGEHGGSPGKH
ncbi:MAG: hypothetical protein AVDCRST_MAG11-2564 [uncultured Gemmatimonadaceae bacterium]|uniref:Uncharacterized protein n=1 Tax=uncultured Gemmatimonadaceae bacterium TaxID=246130 RepID=A0A6J4LHR1_9BACT|nr:MAG: hypothetical protein AVDCRST_MAG11-2564 [uncultured Gemmatimonadaceae bacterium]